MPFEHPTWLVLLLLVPFLAVSAILISKLRGRRWQAFVANRLRPALLKKTPAFSRWVSFAFLLASLALMILSLARPRGDAGTKSETVKGRNVLFALDLSRSMRTPDVKPDRLAQAKAVIYEMMDAMPNDRVGLVGFEGTSYLFAPLTIDHGAVKETVQELDETWIPTGGSDIVGALKLSIDVLRKTPVHNNALILISDGEKHEGKLDDVIEEAKRAGVYIFTVGVGTEKGDFIPAPELPDGKFKDRNNNSVVSQMHPEILRQIASESHGRFVMAGSGIDIPGLAKTALADLDQFELEGRERKVVVEFYQWLLGPALLSLLISIVVATRWRPLAMRTAVAATLAGSVTGANAATQRDAAAALREGRDEEARTEFHELAETAKLKEDAARYRLGEAAAAYHAKDFRKANDAYSRALLSGNAEVDRAAHLGAGPSLFLLGWETLSDGEPYPDQAPADLTAFDAMVGKKILEWLKSTPPDDEDSESEAFLTFNSVIVNWTDSLRHFDSVLKVNPQDKDAVQNRAVVARYLDRLTELLKVEMQESGGAMGDEQDEGDGGGGSGEGKGKGGGGKGKDKKGDQGSNGDKDKDKDGGPGDKEKKDKGSNGDKKDKDGKDGKAKPGESEKERAERLLGQSQDLQKGPLNPGRRSEFSRPEKDW